MSEISEEKKEEVYELVEKQKKAKISWVAIITQLSEEEIKTIAWDIGLIIDEDQIMLPSETKEGKVEAKIQDELNQVILQKVISERIFRYRKKGTKKVNWDRIENITFALDFAGASDLVLDGIALGGALAAIGKAIKSKVEVKAETYACKLDGRIDYTAIKSSQISLLRSNLLEEIRKKYKKKLRYLVSLKYYHELMADPQSGDLLKDVEHKKTILSLCKLVDENVNGFCNQVVNLSVVVSEVNIENYNILLTTGKRINCPKDTQHLNRYSLFLSYRTSINQLYYEMVEQAKIPGIIDFAFDHSFQQANLYEQYLQQLFEELAQQFESQQLLENARIVKVIIQSH